MTEDVKVTLRMPREIRDRIAEMAAREHRSMSAQILVILKQAVRKDQDERE